MDLTQQLPAFHQTETIQTPWISISLFLADGGKVGQLARSSVTTGEVTIDMQRRNRNTKMHRLKWYSTAMGHTRRGPGHGDGQAPAAASSVLKHLLQVLSSIWSSFDSWQLQSEGQRGWWKEAERTRDDLSFSLRVTSYPVVWPETQSHRRAAGSSGSPVLPTAKTECMWYEVRFWRVLEALSSLLTETAQVPKHSGHSGNSYSTNQCHCVV